MAQRQQQFDKAEKLTEVGYSVKGYKHMVDEFKSTVTQEISKQRNQIANEVHAVLDDFNNEQSELEIKKQKKQEQKLKEKM